MRLVVEKKRRDEIQTELTNLAQKKQLNKQLEEILRRQEEAERSIVAGDLNLRNKFHTNATKEADREMLQELQ